MIVLVTGGSRGIGLATVRRLASAGHEVFAASRHPERQQLPAGVTPLVLDVSSPSSAQAAMDSVLSAAGGLDALVNNAGVGLVGSLEETSEEDAHRILEVNLFAPLRLARLAIPVMRVAGAGRIVNVTSMNDILAAPFGAWYSASKAALATASVVLGAEVHAFGIAVTVVAPGLFRTDMAAELGRQRPDPSSPYMPALEALRAQDVERYSAAGDPDQVAEAIADCLTNPHPPARLVVGADAQNFEKLVRESTPDTFAGLLQDYVAQLTQAGGSTDG